MISRREVLRALEGVHDPHVPTSLRSMGMLAEACVEADGRVRVRLRLPCMACPAVSWLTDGVRARLLELDGVTDVDVTIDWRTRWNRDDVDKPARDLMRSNGLQI